MPISPIDCKHERTAFVSSMSGSPPPVREEISVCRDCGRFRVMAQQDGVTIVTTFELATWGQVDAAAQYARLLDADDKPLDHQREAEDLYYLWTRGDRAKEVLRRFARMSPFDAAVIAVRMVDHFGDLGRQTFMEAMERRSDRVRKIKGEER